MRTIKAITYHIKNCGDEIKPAYEQIGLYPHKQRVEYKSPNLLGSIVNADCSLLYLLWRQLVDSYEEHCFDEATCHERFSTEAQFESWARQTSFHDEDVTWEVAIHHISGEIEKFICCGTAPVPVILEEVSQVLKARYPQLDELQEEDHR